MAWHFGLCDLTGVAIGEVANAYERKLTLPLNGLPTAGFTIRLDNPMADAIAAVNGDCLLKVYQDSTLRFVGDVVTFEEQTQSDAGPTMAVTAAGPLWRLAKRLVGVPYPTAQSAWSNTAANLIVLQWVGDTNANKDTGIRQGTLDTLYVTDTESLLMKPVSEAIAELQAAKIPYPINSPPSSSLIAISNFVGTGTEVTLTGRSDDTPTPGPYTWSTPGGTDYALLAPGPAYRAANASRFAIDSHPDKVNVVTGISFNSTQAGASTSPLCCVVARYTDTTHYLIAVANMTNNTIEVRRDDGAGEDVLVTATYEAFLPATWYEIVLAVDETGTYAVWCDPVGTLHTDVRIANNHPDLATGGILATGKCGIYDSSTSPTYPTAGWVGRYYDSFHVHEFTGPQSFDFELAPVEPDMLDATSVTTGVPKIANLNVRTQIGTSKPEVVFEYGTGALSMGSYHRISSREGLCNRAYVLPSGFPTETDIRWSTDPASILARGLFEEVVPFSEDSSQLRQAWADANVQIRKIARHEITFQPSETAPVFGTDYIVGDFVTGRALVNGAARFNALFRIYEVEVSINEEGKVTTSLKLVPD